MATIECILPVLVKLVISFHDNRNVRLDDKMQRSEINLLRKYQYCTCFEVSPSADTSQIRSTRSPRSIHERVVVLYGPNPKMLTQGDNIQVPPLPRV